MARLSLPASSPPDKEIHARSSRSTACITMNFAKSPWKKGDICRYYHGILNSSAGVVLPVITQAFRTGWVSADPGCPVHHDTVTRPWRPARRTPGRRWYLGARLNERNTDCKSEGNQMKEISWWPVNFHRWQGRRDYWRTSPHRLDWPRDWRWWWFFLFNSCVEKIII